MKMKIAFTICSNNYLASAKILSESFLQYHPDYVFYIGLADKYPVKLGIDYVGGATILEVEKLNICNLECLIKKYNIIEFNTAIKPSYFLYFFEKLHAEKVIYIDPDTLVFSRFEEVESLLPSYNIVLTPHITRPVDDGFSPSDYETLRGGVFNLGFLALSNFNLIKNFLTWWHDRVLNYGFGDFSRSMFYDQLWMNFIPCLYDNYFILKHPGYNIAAWNLHERNLTVNNENNYIVNQKFPLRFFHFSGYKFSQPQSISTHLTRYSFEQRIDLAEIFKQYRDLLQANDVEKISKLPIYYYPGLHPHKSKKQTKLNNLAWRLKRSTQVLLTGK
jgi:lipopolysaccharide biosynthesis glycosyltransferase